MTREAIGIEILDQAVGELEICWSRGNEELALDAVRRAFAERRKLERGAADDDRVGALGLTSLECDLLREVDLGRPGGFSTIGDLRRAGVRGVVRLLVALPPDRLKAYAATQGVSRILARHESGRIRSMKRALSKSDRRLVARHLAGRVRIAMASFGINLPMEGAKG